MRDLERMKGYLVVLIVILQMLWSLTTATLNHFTSVNSEDEEEVSSIPKYSSFNEEMDMSNSIPQVGMELESPSQFRDFIKQYGFMRGYDFKFPNNDSDKTIGVCKVDGCLFRAYASFSQERRPIIFLSL